jgi:hypothetical protein
MDAVRMDLVSAAISPAKHTDSGERGGRTEKRSAFHRHEFSCLVRVANESTTMGMSQWRRSLLL